MKRLVRVLSPGRLQSEWSACWQDVNRGTAPPGADIPEKPSWARLEPNDETWTLTSNSGLVRLGPDGARQCTHSLADAGVRWQNVLPVPGMSIAADPLVDPQSHQDGDVFYVQHAIAVEVSVRGDSARATTRDQLICHVPGNAGWEIDG